jgi:hypothetical protein
MFLSNDIDCLQCQQFLVTDALNVSTRPHLVGKQVTTELLADFITGSAQIMLAEPEFAGNSRSLYGEENR